MDKRNNAIARISLPVYLIIVPLISNAIPLFLPVTPVVAALLLLLIPVLTAIVLTAAVEGRKSLAELMGKLLRWQIGLEWYAIAVILPIGLILAAGALAFVLGWTPAFQIQIPARSQLIGNAILIVLVAVFEEFGWRGYALPRLLAYRSPLFSAVMVGIAWGLLHLGLGLLDGRPWLPTILVPFGLSIVLTWLFVHTRGSLAMAMLFHFAIDYAPQFIAGISIAQFVWAQAIVNLAAAVILILFYGVSLQRGSRQYPAAVGAK